LIETNGGLSSIYRRYVTLPQFIFTGRRFDPETSNATTQMYFYRARYYSPTLGRFISRDPIGYGSGMSLYAYVQSKPTVSGDPSGLAPDPTWRDPPGAGGTGEPDPIYDERLKNEYWNRAMYHYDCLHKLNGRTNCPTTPGGHERAYKNWLEQHRQVRDRYELNKEGGSGAWMSDYYDLRVTCKKCWGGPEMEFSAEFRCTTSIGLRFASRIAAFYAQGYAMEATGYIMVTYGVYLLGSAQPLLGAVFVVGGTVIILSGMYATGEAIALKKKANKAVALYCNCKKLVE